MLHNAIMLLFAFAGGLTLSGLVVSSSTGTPFRSTRESSVSCVDPLG